jgi:hypothetical protein
MRAFALFRCQADDNTELSFNVGDMIEKGKDFLISYPNSGARMV